MTKIKIYDIENNDVTKSSNKINSYTSIKEVELLKGFDALQSYFLLEYKELVAPYLSGTVFKTSFNNSQKKTLNSIKELINTYTTAPKGQKTLAIAMLSLKEKEGLQEIQEVDFNDVDVETALVNSTLGKTFLLDTKSIAYFYTLKPQELAGQLRKIIGYNKNEENPADFLVRNKKEDIKRAHFYLANKLYSLIIQLQEMPQDLAGIPQPSKLEYKKTDFLPTITQYTRGGDVSKIEYNIKFESIKEKDLNNELQELIKNYVNLIDPNSYQESRKTVANWIIDDARGQDLQKAILEQEQKLTNLVTKEAKNDLKENKKILLQKIENYNLLTNPKHKTAILQNILDTFKIEWQELDLYIKKPKEIQKIKVLKEKAHERQHGGQVRHTQKDL